jgi:uncharacterized repeat protein (TIGR03803 family)
VNGDMRASVIILYGSVVLASCSPIMGGSTPPSPEAAFAPSQSDLARQSRAGFKDLYYFKGSPNGAQPSAPLVELNGNLYGTTEIGGSGDRGTVFEISKARKETVLYRFHGAPDGEQPTAGLLVANGKLYGTTSGGGELIGYGTIFEISTSGAERVLYRFKPKHGIWPTGELIGVRGTLYGTATKGGPHNIGDGVVFALSKSGTERVVYEFPHDTPEGGVTYANGKLYGTAYPGPGSSIWGYVFELSLSGTESDLYDFKGYPNDGGSPLAGVIYQNGELYGTTFNGGASKECGDVGCGSVFEVNATTGAENMLYSFQQSTSGAHPVTGLLALKGALYGTVPDGGEYGEGTIFAVSASAETTLYTFLSPGRPFSSLIAVNGSLFGTTFGKFKRSHPDQMGTVFELPP